MRICDVSLFTRLQAFYGVAFISKPDAAKVRSFGIRLILVLLKLEGGSCVWLEVKNYFSAARFCNVGEMEIS